MKVDYVEMEGFRGCSQRLRLTFSPSFTVIDGRNGAGKSTVFDAIEFALTGTLSKYGAATANNETVDEYLWWRGSDAAASASEGFVEVGFVGRDGSRAAVRRTRFVPEATGLNEIQPLLCDTQFAPESPWGQLCTTSIIRDELITGLSLDMEEGARFRFLRAALGSSGADHWIERAAELLKVAKEREKVGQKAVDDVNIELASAARQLDRVRAELVMDESVADATSRLQLFTKSELPTDQLPDAVTKSLSELNLQAALLRELRDQWAAVDAARRRIGELATQVEMTTGRLTAAQQEQAALLATAPALPPSDMAAQAKRLADLVALARQHGLRDGKCPVCATAQSHERFEAALRAAEADARALDAQAVRVAEANQRLRVAAQTVANATDELARLTANISELRERIADFDNRLIEVGAEPGSSREALSDRLDSVGQLSATVTRDLRTIDAIRLNADLHRSQFVLAEVEARSRRAQEQFGRLRKARTIAEALHDAARRAAAETLEARLDRVLPLMSELYRRLKPHPQWDDIEYAVRGDVRRFLRLKVGDGLNPQFLYSSGQRRATGLAFLLAMNLSVAWSRWESLMLDDPVQHIDDFRAVHLVEVLAQLVAGGRQVICSVEDAALADLLCRRLPVAEIGTARRITLGVDDQHHMAAASRDLLPFPRTAEAAQVYAS